MGLLYSEYASVYKGGDSPPHDDGQSRTVLSRRADWDQYLRDVYGERALRAQSTALADKAFFYCVCSLLRLRASRFGPNI